MSIKSRYFYILIFTLFGALVFPLLWFINSIIFSFELDMKISDLIETVQFFLVPSWIFQTLLLAKSDGYVFPYAIQVIFLINMVYWGIVGYVVTSPKISSYWLKVFSGLLTMILLTILISIVHGS